MGTITVHNIPDAGPQMDALIAEQVMPHEIVIVDECPCGLSWRPCQQASLGLCMRHTRQLAPAPYSTNDDAADRVIDQLRHTWIVAIEYHGFWTVRLTRRDGHDRVTASRPTRAEAIGLVAVLSVC